MIVFSVEKQSFYETEFKYPGGIPSDTVVLESSSQHQELLSKLNNGCRIFRDLSTSTPRPTPYHTWEDGGWVDNTTEEDKLVRHAENLRPLSRRQFRLALVEYDLDERILEVISAIEDKSTRKKLEIEYADSTTFERMSDSVIAIAELLDLSIGDLNSLWEYGLTL